MDTKPKALILGAPIYDVPYGPALPTFNSKT